MNDRLAQLETEAKMLARMTEAGAGETSLAELLEWSVDEIKLLREQVKRQSVDLEELRRFRNRALG